MLDFTLDQSKEIFLSLSNYKIYTVLAYLENSPKYSYCILRHDVDRKYKNALKMAEIEHELDIKSTYYFRYPIHNSIDIIKKINKLDHEIGYHYEVLSKTNNNHIKAIKLFEQELKNIRKICDVKTICAHGSPLSKYDNRDIWNFYNFKQFDIIGDASLSITEKNYYTDTGRNWRGMHNIRDNLKLNMNANEIPILNTRTLINYINNKEFPSLYIVMHPERWSSNFNEWIFSTVQDSVFNLGKQLLLFIRQ